MDKMRNSSVYDCSVIDLGRHQSPRLGNLSVVEGGSTVPFDVKRVFHIYDVPGGASRGGHAHREIYEFIVAASGSFMVTVDDGAVKRSYLLNRPYQGLLVVPGVWVTLEEFSSGSVALVLTSEYYAASDHIKSYEEFLEIKSSGKMP